MSGLGLPVTIILTPGQEADITQAETVHWLKAVVHRVATFGKNVA